MSTFLAKKIDFSYVSDQENFHIKIEIISIYIMIYEKMEDYIESEINKLLLTDFFSIKNYMQELNLKTNLAILCDYEIIDNNFKNRILKHSKIRNYFVHEMYKSVNKYDYIYIYKKAKDLIEVLEELNQIISYYNLSRYCNENNLSLNTLDGDEIYGYYLEDFSKLWLMFNDIVVKKN